MAKKKSKEFRLAEIAYALGRDHALTGELSGEENTLVEMGAVTAIAKWKEETGGRKKQPSSIDRACKKWKQMGQPAEGVMFGGARYLFEPDGEFNLLRNFEANIGRPGKS